MQDRLVEHKFVSGCMIACKQLPPFDPFPYPQLDHLGLEPRHKPTLMYGPSVVRCLQQTRNYTGMVGDNSRRFFLKTYISGVREFVGLPPTLLLALGGKPGHPSPLVRIGDVVKITQVSYVPRRSTTLASFHAAHLGRRAQQMSGNLFDSNATFQAKRP